VSDAEAVCAQPEAVVASETTERKTEPEVRL
jgi:hypothetical protein